MPLLLLLLLVWTWASLVNVWGECDIAAAVIDGCIWLEVVRAAVVLRGDPEKNKKQIKVLNILQIFETCQINWLQYGRIWGIQDKNEPIALSQKPQNLIGKVRQSA